MLWLILSEVSFSQLTSLLLDHGEADHHGREHVGKKKVAHGRQEAERRRKQGSEEPKKGTIQWYALSDSFPTRPQLP